MCPVASNTETGRPPIPRWPVVAATLLAVAVSYFACASAATYPVIARFGSEMPGQLTDPLEHLWLMRWSRACLLEGRSPFFCPGLNAPTGVPLGYFPTMHVQTLGYLALRLITDNDVACFNTLWFSGFVATGLGTFVLAWWVVRRVGPAWLAGLGTMLCGPMLMHAHGHLETMQVGAVPLFLIAWLRLVDRPSRSRLAVAVGLYWLMVACAPYFAVLAIFPAAWYVAWSVVATESPSRVAWMTGRVGWLAGFGAIVVPGLLLLFSSQVWAIRHGFSMTRSRLEFDQLGAPGWSSLVPSPLHNLGKLTGLDAFARTGTANRMSECSSYLGVVTLGLLAYAAIRRLRFPRAGYWWSLLALMIVLSWGSALDLGSVRIKMPAGWIYGIFPPFHLIRVPARFNLFASVCAAVPAAAALADVWARIGERSVRIVVATALAGLMLADLSMVPFETSVIPPMPTAYQHLTCQNPETRVVDAPMFGSSEGQVFSSLWGYWQSIHLARTTAGYPGLPNVPFESEIVRGSPFRASLLADPEYLARPGPRKFGPVDGVEPYDYVWLYLTSHGFDHVMIHQGTWTDRKYWGGSQRLKTFLDEAKVFEDADIAVFDRARLHPPSSLTWLCKSGFRQGPAMAEGGSFGVLREARVALYNPTPDRPIVLSLVESSAFAGIRQVRLMDEGREVASWSVPPDARQTLETPPFRLGGGVRELRLIADGEDRPNRSADRLDDARTPYSLRVRAVKLRFADAGD